jgi:photosystem II stability/assembly factor-like uncharacterized protein
MKYRFNWNAPIINSPHDPKIMYHAGNVLFRSTNGGMNWEKISPDLTRNDTTKQGKSGGPITNEGAGGENYNTIYYVIESPHEPGVIYTGSDCGLVHLTRDGGKTWKNVTPAGLPESNIHSIEVSRHDRGTVYISATRYKFNDYASYTYKSSDYGVTWTKITSGVDNDDFIKVIREDVKVKDLLYAGSERGFYISNTGGKQWHKFQLNLPVVPVTDLIIRDNDLVASTAGRAFWILDDLGAIQQSRADLTSASVKLFTPKPTYRLSGPPAYLAAMGIDIPGLGKNPSEGVTFDFYLKDKQDTVTATLEILDGSGKVLRSFSSKKNESFKPYPGGPPAPMVLPAVAGVNRFAWDFRTEVLPDVSGVFVYGDYRGHRVAPGKYIARLKYNGEISETEFEILSDPRLKVQASDWQEQQRYIGQMEDGLREMHQSVNKMRKVKTQVESHQELLKADPAAKELNQLGKELIREITGWEGNIIEPRSKNGQDVINWPNKMNSEFMNVRSSLDTHDPRVTQGVKDRAADLQTEWNALRRKLDQINAKLESYNAMYKEKNLPAVITGKKEDALNN